MLDLKTTRNVASEIKKKSFLEWNDKFLFDEKYWNEKNINLDKSASRRFALSSSRLIQIDPRDIGPKGK